MKVMAVSAFKMHALRAVDGVAKTRESLVVTKRGKALVRAVGAAATTDSTASILRVVDGGLTAPDE